MITLTRIYAPPALKAFLDSRSKGAPKQELEALAEAAIREKDDSAALDVRREHKQQRSKSLSI